MQLLALLTLLPLALAGNSLEPQLVSATVSLAGALTRTSTTYVLKQVRAPESVWTVGLVGSEGYVEAHIGSPANEQRTLAQLVRLRRDENNVTFYAVQLPSPPALDAVMFITIGTVSPGKTSSLPTALVQTAEQMGRFWSGDLLESVAGLPADELTGLTEVKVKIQIPSPRLIEFTTPDGFKGTHTKGGATIIYTATGVPSTAQAHTATVHYVQPDAVVSVRKLDRLVEVSHWGANLAVQDGIDLFNSGPLLKGFFSRLAHQRSLMQGLNTPLTIKGIALVLPPRITSPYFYDIVGNVSTSRFRPSTSSTPSVRLPSSSKKSVTGSSLLEITPRYPLLGGWNYTFTVGYDAPLGDFVRRKPDGSYLLSVPFLTAIRDVAFDDVSMRIRLPESARNIKVYAPFHMDALSHPTADVPSVEHTYLDSTGRPTVYLSRRDCTDRHDENILVEYELPLLNDLLQKPLAVATAFATVFLFVIAVRKLEWGIGK